MGLEGAAASAPWFLSGGNQYPLFPTDTHVPRVERRWECLGTKLFPNLAAVLEAAILSLSHCSPLPNESLIHTPSRRLKVRGCWSGGLHGLQGPKKVTVEGTDPGAIFTRQC